MLEYDACRAGLGHLRQGNKFPLLQAEHLTPDNSGVSDPPEDSNDQNHNVHPGGYDRRKGQGQKQNRQGHHDVHDPHNKHIYDAAEVAGDKANEGPKGG